MRCLIIDDDDGPRSLMEQLITRAGHTVCAVGAVRGALEALRAAVFDVAIVDMEMPDASGPAVIGSLRELRPEIPVLVVSGHDDRRHVLAALDAGADGYILKDEVGESLTDSLFDIRAGHTPLSPRVATILLRQLRFRRFAGENALARIRLRDR